MNQDERTLEEGCDMNSTSARDTSMRLIFEPWTDARDRVSKGCVHRKGLAIAAILFMLTACGGGGSGGTVSTGPKASCNFSNTVQARHSYTPYVTGSHAYSWAPDTKGNEVREIYIGGDIEPRYHFGGDIEPGQRLRHILTERGIRIYMGASRDGAGVERLKNYETDLMTRDGSDPEGLSGDGFKPFATQPRLYLDSDLLAPENASIARSLTDSIRILNDFLPPEFQIAVAGTRSSDIAQSGEITVSLVSPATIGTKCGAGVVACASNVTIADRTRSSTLYLPADLDTSEYTFPRKVIVHELLHALGIRGHIDSIEFPDSIMGGSGEYIPNMGHVISKIDREVLQIMYMSQRTDLYNDWDEWSDTAFHLMGRSDDEVLNFGVSLFNGLPQPWVRGAMPNGALAENNRLQGTATWTGSLLGYSGPSPIAGDVELAVSLPTLSDPDNEQDLRFRNLYFLNRFETGTADRWFDPRDIDYKVNISGNGFHNVRGEGYEQGFVTGAFLGAGHEYMGGTLKRTDMVSAFGGDRFLTVPLPKPPPPTTPVPLFRYKALQTSDELQHSVVHPNWSAIVAAHGKHVGRVAVAYGDFDGDGDEDIFLPQHNDSFNAPVPVEMYLNDGYNNYHLDNSIFGNDVPGLVQPRKALTGDFNSDGRPDIFVAGHGWDFPPWPGEPPLLLLSSESGLRKAPGLEDVVGYHHGAASADIDNDGDLDIFLPAFGSSTVLRNDGKGVFTREEVQEGSGAHTVELVDVDDDGYVDLLLASYEDQGNPTTIFWGSRSGNYTGSNKTILPAVPEYGTVVDIDVGDLDGDGNKDLVLSRTGSTQFYKGYHIQVLAGRQGRRFVADDRGVRIEAGTDPGGVWFSWLRLEDINGDGHLDILVDDDYTRDGRGDFAISWINDGSGQLKGPVNTTSFVPPLQPYLADPDIREEMNAIIRASDTAIGLSLSTTAASAGYDSVSVIEEDPSDPVTEVGQLTSPGIENGEFEVTYSEKSRRKGVRLALGRRSQTYDTGSTHFSSFGGWLDHSFFVLSVLDFRSLALDENLGIRAEAWSVGAATGTNPRAVGGRASWSGVMIAVDGGQDSRGALVRGDAEITIDDFVNPSADVNFTNIHDLSSGDMRDDIVWAGLTVHGGGFGVDCSSSPTNCIDAQFYGPNHVEVGGSFVRDDVVGSFGARRK